MEEQKNLCDTCLFFDSPCILHPDLNESVDRCHFYIKYKQEEKQKPSLETINKHLGYN